MELEDRMNSFFLAETCKYLYLLFDEDNFIYQGNYVFSTEGHIFPVFGKSSRTTRTASTATTTPTTTTALTNKGGGEGGDINIIDEFYPQMCFLHSLYDEQSSINPPRSATSSNENRESTTTTTTNTTNPTSNRACHIPDKNPNYRCGSDEDCGISGDNCTKRKCSPYQYCYTPT